jgi:hypothetical protein
LGIEQDLSAESVGIKTLTYPSRWFISAALVDFEKLARVSTTLFDSKIDHAGAACYGNDAQDRRNWERMVFCCADLH